MVSDDLLKEQEAFYNFCKNYPYFGDVNSLDLQLFCVHIGLALDTDGAELYPDFPRAIYDHLLQRIICDYDLDKAQELIKYQNLVDIDDNPEASFYYPDGYRTYVTVAGISLVYLDWVTCIGYNYLKLPEPDGTPMLLEWIKPQWIYTKALLTGLHNKICEMRQQVDKKGVKERGYSLHEAAKVSYDKNVSYDEAVEQLKSRFEAQAEAFTHIEKAIKEAFYLEAITLQENIISNCIYNFLKAKKIKIRANNFSTLLAQVNSKKLDLDVESLELFKEVNDWRKDRNSAIHGFFTERSEEILLSQNQFMESAKVTANKGLELAKNVYEWFESQSIFFIDFRQERSTSKDLH